MINRNKVKSSKGGNIVNSFMTHITICRNKKLFPVLFGGWEKQWLIVSWRAWHSVLGSTFQNSVRCLLSRIYHRSHGLRNPPLLSGIFADRNERIKGVIFSIFIFLLYYTFIYLCLPVYLFSFQLILMCLLSSTLR